MKKLFFVCLVLSLTVACQGPRGHLGETGAPGAKGDQGEMGPQGPVGPAGEVGESCSVVKLGSVTNITCGETTVQVVDGTDGENGQDGVDATPVETVALCPETSGGSFKEYLLRLPSGEVLAVYSANGNVGLAKLSPGSYVTTDGRNCHFVVTGNGQVL